MGPLPAALSKDPKYLLTFQDGVTKFPKAVPLLDAMTETVTQAIGEHLIAQYGAGLTLISDNGHQFVSKVLKAACKKLGIIKIEITSFHPQANPIETS